MFGLEKQKSPKIEEFVFELEKDLKDPIKYNKMKVHIEAMIQKLKGVLRSGGSQNDFDEHGLLLHGYSSVLKIMSRAATTKAKK